MRKLIVGALLLASATFASAANYGGLGLGYSEACRTKYSPGFAGGDCIKANVALHGFMGHELSNYFSLEASLDTSFDAGHIADLALDAILANATGDESFYYDNESLDRETKTHRWSVSTVSASAFFWLPLGEELRLFAGPSVGGSYTDIDYDVTYIGNPNSYEGSESEFGLNYGGALGVEFSVGLDTTLRLQWQNWRSLDTNSAVNGEFNSNTFTVNIVGYFN
jgi:hypothetical protein